MTLEPDYVADACTDMDFLSWGCYFVFWEGCKYSIRRQEGASYSQNDFNSFARKIFEGYSVFIQNYGLSRGICSKESTNITKIRNINYFSNQMAKRVKILYIFE